MAKTAGDRIKELQADRQKQQDVITAAQAAITKIDADIDQLESDHRNEVLEKLKAQALEHGYSWDVLVGGSAKPAKKRVAKGNKTTSAAARKSKDEPRVYDYLAVKGSGANKPGFDSKRGRRPSDWHTGDNKTVNDKKYFKASVVEIASQEKALHDWKVANPGK